MELPAVEHVPVAESWRFDPAENPLVRTIGRIPVSVRTKLLAGFALIALLLVVVGVLGLVALGRSSSRLTGSGHFGNMPPPIRVSRPTSPSSRISCTTVRAPPRTQERPSAGHEAPPERQLPRDRQDRPADADHVLGRRDRSGGCRSSRSCGRCSRLHSLPRQRVDAGSTSVTTRCSAPPARCIRRDSCWRHRSTLIDGTAAARSARPTHRRAEPALLHEELADLFIGSLPRHPSSRSRSASCCSSSLIGPLQRTKAGLRRRSQLGPISNIQSSDGAIEIGEFAANVNEMEAAAGQALPGDFDGQPPADRLPGEHVAPRAVDAAERDHQFSSVLREQIDHWNGGAGRLRRRCAPRRQRLLSLIDDVLDLEDRGHRDRGL